MNTRAAFTLSQLLVTVAALSLMLGLLLPALAPQFAHAKPSTPRAPQGMTISSPSWTLTRTDHEITIRAGNTVIEQFRIMHIDKADAYSRVVALCSASLLSPSSVGSKVRLIVQEDEHITTLSHRCTTDKRSTSWPAITRTPGDGVTSLTFYHPSR